MVHAVLTSTGLWHLNVKLLPPAKTSCQIQFIPSTTPHWGMKNVLLTITDWQANRLHCYLLEKYMSFIVMICCHSKCSIDSFISVFISHSFNNILSLLLAEIYFQTYVLTVFLHKPWVITNLLPSIHGC